METFEHLSVVLCSGLAHWIILVFFLVIPGGVPCKTLSLDLLPLPPAQDIGPFCCRYFTSELTQFAT